MDVPVDEGRKREYPHWQSSACVAQEGDECLKVSIGMKHVGAAIAPMMT